MKPFNLEAALAGAKVITGLGKPATDIAYLPSVNSPYKVGAVIDGGIRYFTETGRISKYSPNPLLDLFMAPVKKEGWINIHIGRMTGQFIYKTEGEARASGGLGPIDCIRIKWEI
jgi:hypothetical protein